MNKGGGIERTRILMLLNEESKLIRKEDYLKLKNEIITFYPPHFERLYK